MCLIVIAIHGFCPVELAGKYLRVWKPTLCVLCVALFSCNAFPSGKGYHCNLICSKEAIDTCFTRHGIMAKKRRHELFAGKFQRKGRCEIRVRSSYQLLSVPGHRTRQTTVAVRSYHIAV
jgi:hypothetical protein